MVSLFRNRRDWWRPSLVAAVVALALGTVFSAPARAAVIKYYAATGLLQIDNSGPNYVPLIGGVEIYVQNSTILSSGATIVTPSSGWTFRNGLDCRPLYGKYGRFHRFGLRLHFDRGHE